MAEEVGFEPTDAFTSTDFKSAALSHSATPPKIVGCTCSALDDRCALAAGDSVPPESLR